jgi:D-glycero-alpha-D-manno-heptose-7-phosphate kinase
MIISKTPYRISFFGGGTDYPKWYLKNGGAVLSAAIDKFIYISCRKLPPFFEHKYRIAWSITETVKKINQIKHKPTREMIKIFSIKDGLEIHYDGDLPARSGMGSSSVFVVGLMNALSNYVGKKINKKELSKRSIRFEQKNLKEVVGSQDQIAAAYGGFNKIFFKTNGDFKVKNFSLSNKNIKKLDKNLLLLYTGLERTAHDIAKSFIHKLQSSKKSHIIEIANFVKEGEKLLLNGDSDNFGRLLHESWLEKKSLSPLITNSSIDNIYNSALNKGALGGKLLGAGGGGFFLFYVPHYKQKYFIKHFTKLITIPFNFTNERSNILFRKFTS